MRSACSISRGMARPFEGLESTVRGVEIEIDDAEDVGCGLRYPTWWKASLTIPSGVGCTSSDERMDGEVQRGDVRGIYRNLIRN